MVRVVMVSTFTGLEWSPGIFRVGPGDPGTVVVLMSGGAAAASPMAIGSAGHLLHSGIS